DADAALVAFRGNGPHDRASGEVTRIAGPPPSVSAEEALVQLAVFRARELASPGGQLEHGVGRLTRHDLDRPRMSQEIALAHGVSEVLLPRILRVARPE